MNRELARNILSQYLSIEKNIIIIEGRIFLNSKTEKEYMKNLYDCIGYLSCGWVSEYHNDIKESKVGFDLSVYSEYISLEEETDIFLSEDIEVEEGALTCNKCKSNKTFSYTKQVRSSDEGTSVFATCYNCQNKWRES